MSLHYTPVSQGLVFTCFEGRCLKQLRNFMGILPTDIWLRLQLWLLMMTDLSKLSYLVSGLKLTFVPWSKSTFALTYLTAKLKKKLNLKTCIGEQETILETMVKQVGVRGHDSCKIKYSSLIMYKKCNTKSSVSNQLLTVSELDQCDW